MNRAAAPDVSRGAIVYTRVPGVSGMRKVEQNDNHERVARLVAGSKGIASGSSGSSEVLLAPDAP